MASARHRRLPISCEPCRIRKIRCPRDGTPCGSCVRREVPASQCQYARSHRSVSLANQPLVAGAPLSPSASGSSLSPLNTSNEDLSRRVQRLEQLLRMQCQDALPDNATIDRPVLQAALEPNVNLFAQGFANRSTRHLTGSLHVSGSGHVRFVPASLDWDATLGLASNDIDREHGLLNVICNPGMGGTGGNHEPLSALPPKTLCDELVHVYFSSFASLLHILHNPTFETQYNSFKQDAKSVPLSWLALLYTILATAVLALPPDSTILDDLSRKILIPEKIAELSDKYRSMAMKCLQADNYLWNHNVTTLQALVILIYGIGHTHGPTWTLVGLACNLAMRIGCHVDPDAFDLDIVAKEERRRCWAALMMLYTQQNTTMGHIAYSRSIFPSNTRDPADVDDDQLSTHSTLHSRQATQMTYLLLKFRLYDICSEVCDHVFGDHHPNAYTIKSLDMRIQAEQQRWQARYTSPSGSDDLPEHHYAHLNVLHSYSGHLVLLLHQHAVFHSRPGASSLQWSRERSFEDAKRVLEAHQEFQTSPRLVRFQWYNRGLGSFHAFHAAVILSSLMRFPASDIEMQQRYSLLQGCVARFQNMSNLSPLCAKALPILQYLLHSYEITPLASNEAVESMQSAVLNDFDWEAIISQIQPQQWLTPANVPWDQWNDMIRT